jgi:hypothetical protein
MYFGRWHLGLAAVLVSVICGAFATIFCGRASLLKRFFTAGLAGLLTAVFYTYLALRVFHVPVSKAIVPALWLCFSCALISVIGAVLTELSLPDVENRA